MKFEVIGSGGCVALPKPLCKCRICEEARKKGRPYSRMGCSFFLHDINMLVDTPEDIVAAINASGIEEIKYVLFSHADPDHVLGFRVFEHLRLNWFDVSDGMECSDPIEVMALAKVMRDLNSIKSKFGPYLDYYDEVRNLIVRKEIESSVEIENIKLTILPIEDASVFVFEEANKKLVYAPCDVKPFPHSDILYDSDILVIGNTVVGDNLKDGYVLKDDSFLKTDLFSMEEIIELKSKYRFKKVIMTHLEEDWGKSYDDYRELEKVYDGIEFAFDGMIVEL